MVHIIGKEKGFVFCMDVSVAFIIVLILAFISLAAIFYLVEIRAENFKCFEQEKNAMLFVDSLIKRSSDQNGLAKVDFQRRSVLENEIESATLSANIEKLEERLVKNNVIEIIIKGSSEEPIFKNDKIAKKDCKHIISIERGISIDGDFKVMRVVFCDG
ncbi:MAG: hypothetical protein J7J87_00995 [Candidatus Diapherotrites archaeon]|uniref:Uncharacterized protein n=1 Tax=Candidatus Iainarchaeum sp. TaxID=3101447 RepID=A0A497JJJ6_9ARCH|nr:hypothetical protein [Candidatus Diapherotrites archaeon]RLG70089.1 MAG: hypothetical protein DRO07_01025 [Candidatus Diapherotrites archaeon]